MTDIFDTFAQLYQAEIDRPALEDGAEYPAVLVQGPTSNDMLAHLHYKPETHSIGMWFRFAVNKNGEPVWSKSGDLVEVRHYLYLGKLDTNEQDADAVKAAFLRGEVNFIGTPSTGLRNLRYALYENDAIKEMGRAKYDLDDFLYRQVKVVIRHSPNASEPGRPYINIGRINRFEDLMGAIGPKVAPEDVAWSPREEREDAGSGLF